jgi:excisionase family DNA binding protein
MAELNLMTLPELAEKLRVKRSWVYRQTRYKGPNKIPFIKAGRFIRFELDKVMAWLEAITINNSVQ